MGGRNDEAKDNAVDEVGDATTEIRMNTTAELRKGTLQIEITTRYSSDACFLVNVMILLRALYSLSKLTFVFCSLLLENGMISSMELTVKETLALPPGKKIVLHHNRELQQVGQAAGLLSGFLGTLGSDFQQLPICAKSWKTMSKASKEHAYDQVKRVFYYEDDKRGWIKQEILQRIENCWRNSRNHLFHKIYDEELTFEENIKRKPVGIEANHWKKFLQYRMDDDTKEKCRKNAVNRSKQQYTHTGGSKTMARKRHEEEQRLGRPIGRGEGWTISHKKKNEKYMNEEARLVGEAIEFVESQDPSSKEFSQNDSLAQVRGKEHPGRVRGLDIGTCPSRCFRNIPEQSDYGVQIEEYQMEIVKLKAEAAELKAEAAELKAAAAEEKAKRQRMEAEAAEEKAKRQIMETEAAEGKAKIQTMGDLLTYVIQQQGGNLPPEIAAGLDSLRSAPTSSHAR
nr:uncharacterized protein LOC112729537 [Arachis hypogaea]